MNAERPFVGTWHLLSSEFRLADGRVHYPLGHDATGLLIYDALGNVAAQLMQVGRRNLSSGLETAERLATIQAAFDGYTAYFGTYTLHPDQSLIIHHVQASLFPNWVGTQQKRFYHFSDDGNQLTLTTPPIGSPENKAVGTLVWRRVLSF